MIDKTQTRIFLQHSLELEIQTIKPKVEMNETLIN
jgi:hypothetical protein